MNLYSLSVLLFSFGVLLIAILALSKRKDEIAVRFALFSISVCGWGFLYSIWTSQPYSPETILKLVRASEVFAVFIPICWIHFVFSFIGREEPWPRFYLINYVIGVVLACLSPTPLFFTGVHEVPIFRYYKSPGPIFYVFFALFFVLIPYAFFYLAKACHNAKGAHKLQLKFLLLGWLIAFLAGAATFFPAFKITGPLWLLFLLPLYPFFIGIPLIRYGLFDPQHIANAFQREKLAAIGTIAASLNHELRNPLYIAQGRIQAHIDAIDRSLYPKEEKTYEVLNAAHQQLLRAMDIIQRFSDFAKPANSQRDKERVYLKETLENVLELVSNEFQLSKIQLIPPVMNGEVVCVNRRQLEEIFFNLILNACHAMGEKGGQLRISVVHQNEKVVIEIADTGPGIPDNHRMHIFDPFFSTKGEKGSGLGLYITKQLVERNGGKIAVKSKLGAGTKFTLSFPSKHESL